MLNLKFPSSGQKSVYSEIRRQLFIGRDWLRLPLPALKDRYKAYGRLKSLMWKWKTRGMVPGHVICRKVNGGQIELKLVPDKIKEKTA